jgi:hypothetical protein
VPRPAATMMAAISMPHVYALLISRTMLCVHWGQIAQNLCNGEKPLIYMACAFVSLQ